MPHPPVPNDTTLAATHSLVKFSIHTSTQISRRTSAVLETLQQPSQNDNNAQDSGKKPPLIALTATSTATTKLISIVEIAKRELAAKKVKCFQYNVLSSEVVDVSRRKKGGEDDGDDQGEGQFETMGEREMGETKKRNGPVLTVYLCLSAVRELRVAVGEQVS